MQLAKPAILQYDYKRKKSVCDDKNCQSTKKHSYEKCPVRPVSLCDDKNCQSSKPMCYDKKCQVKADGTQSSYMWSVSKTASNQIGTQPEITRNIMHSA